MRRRGGSGEILPAVVSRRSKAMFFTTLPMSFALHTSRTSSRAVTVQNSTCSAAWFSQYRPALVFMRRLTRKGLQGSCGALLLRGLGFGIEPLLHVVTQQLLERELLACTII